MVRHNLLVLAGGALASPCFAQTATLEVSHDHATGLVQPGELVRLTCTLSWTGAAMAAWIVGDAAATPDVGTAANNGGPFVGSLINYGTPIGGSVRGVDVGSTPPGAIWPHPAWFHNNGMAFLHFDWTALQSAGQVAFEWVPDPAFPDALFYATLASFNPTPLPTTYIGTSLTFVPGPPAAMALAIGGSLAARRRR